MSDRPYGYRYCKACNKALYNFSEQADGLHSLTESSPSCFRSWIEWYERTKRQSAFKLKYNSPERSVAIDEWLEAGHP